MNRNARAALVMAAACTVLAGCDRVRERSGSGTAATDTAAADSTFSPAEDRLTLPTSRIYHTLTSFEWYERGEPLLHDGRAYRPEGMPVAASLAEMAQAGEFKGVEYYVRSGDPAPNVYVPVFQGYWQAFRFDPSAPATPVDDGAPDDSVDAPVDPPDSAAARA